mgnify:CR=1 FL=1
MMIMIIQMITIQKYINLIFQEMVKYPIIQKIK